MKKDKNTKRNIGIVLITLFVIIILVIAFSSSVQSGPIHPVPTSQSFSFSIQNPGSVTQRACSPYTFSNVGTVSFSWYTANGGTVTFTVVDSTGTQLYSSDASTGSGSFTAYGGESFEFCAYDWSAEGVNVQGINVFS